MTHATEPCSVAYLGWSGFCLVAGDAPPVFIDPPAGTDFPDDGEIVILLTHGHPEHLGGTVDLMKRGHPEHLGGPVTLVASPPLCRYFERGHRTGAVAFRPAAAGQEILLPGGLSLSVFAWTHMPLLPPGFGAALLHVWRLLRRAPAAWRIVRTMLAGPIGPGPMLGYRLRRGGIPFAIAYGEGLHRRCLPDKVARDCAHASRAVLLAAVEPEDAAMLPRLLEGLGVGRIVLYAPHARWRTLFAMPHADLARLENRLAAAGLQAGIAEAPALSRPPA